MAKLLEKLGSLTDSPADHPAPSSPTPEEASGDGTEVLSFTCRCSNVRITGRIATPKSEKSTDSHIQEITLGSAPEKSKHPIYVGYDAPDAERKSRRLSHTRDGELSVMQPVLEPAWRICWLCDTRLYRAEGKRRGDGAVEEANVIVDRQSGIIVNSSETSTSSDDGAGTLPYSKLALPKPPSSNFGRPPQEPLTVYPPASQPPPARHSTHLPDIADPFFLPPPFIPSHPHLRDLCANAVEYLTARHSSAEIDVKNYIAVKAREMRELEEDVRAEVELMWDRYVQGPGREDVRDRERRRSQSIGGGSMDRLGPGSSNGRGRNKGGFEAQPTSTSGMSTVVGSVAENPILRSAGTATFNTGASLLSASISQASYMPRAPPLTDEVDDTIDELAKTYDKTGDQRAQAMSYVFSHMTEAMGSNGGPEEGEDEDEVVVEDMKGKDSWAGEERSQSLKKQRSEVEAGTSENTGRGKGNGDEAAKVGHSALAGGKDKKSLGTDGKGKQKAKVSFEEPLVDGEETKSSRKEASEDDDYVFDFELDDRPSSTPLAPKTSATGLNSDITRNRNIIQDTLSSTYASNAPSHRSAHRRLLAGEKDLYAPVFRRKVTSSGSNDDIVSNMATSVPIAIAFHGHATNGQASRAIPYAFERKTSLSDKEGILVPPLIKAMRQRGIVVEGNSLGLTTPISPAKTRRNGDGGGKSVQVGFKADPGPVLETMTDQDAGETEDVGALRENKKFVPPHVLARKESLKSGDVGWRSMISES